MPAYDVPQGWTPNKYWSAYAESFAQEGSDDQLIAALTGAVPEAWANRFMPNLTNGRVALRKEGSDEYDDEATRRFNEGIGKANSKFGGWQNASSQPYLDMYGRSLQNRLRNDFKKNRQGMEQQGIANLMDQTQDVIGDDFKAIDGNLSARGLLHSGKRDAAQSRAAAARAGELNKSVGDYVNQLSDTERNLNSDVFGAEINSAVNQASLNDIVTQSLFNRMKQKIGGAQQDAQSAQGFGSGIGSALGSFAGRK